MSNKKIVRLATIRDNTDHVCPFGLNIPVACHRAGALVENMTPVLRVDEDGFDTLRIKDKEFLAEVVKANMEVLMWGEEEPHQCIYANKLFEQKPKVECNYGDQAAGVGSTGLAGSPSYTQYFSSGYSSVPISYYSDDPTRSGGSYESMMSGAYASDETDKEKITK